MTNEIMTKWRAEVWIQGDSNVLLLAIPAQYQTFAERRLAMTWAQRLKRVFDIDVATCSECGGEVKIIASIEDLVVIRTILAHVDKIGKYAGDSLLPDCRASPSPPMGSLV